MKINIKYGQSILCLPGEQLSEYLPQLSEGEMRVLLYLLIRGEFRLDPDACRARAVKELDMPWAEVEESLLRLCSHGVIELPDAEVSKLEEPKKPRASVRADNPSYTKEETAAIIGGSPELKKLIDDSCRILGRILGGGETTTLVSMYNYLHLPPDYIIMLVEYCVSIDKSSLRYIERMAYSLFDRDITTVAQLSAQLETEKEKNDTVSRLRDLFGIGGRAFTSKEKKLVEAWVDTYGYSFEIINEAYELTISAIKEPSIPYAGAILKKWYDSGFKTLEDVQGGIKKSSSEPKKKPMKKAETYDADEFMELAFARSYPKKTE